MSARPVALVALAALAATALAGCAPAGGAAPARIVVTTNILGDVTAALVGDAGEVTTLMKPNADPHSFEISAREAASLAEADLLVSNGLGLEENVEQHLETAATAGAARFVAGEHIDVVDYAEGSADPHFWTDPARMVDVVDALERALGEIDGIDANEIAANADAYRAELAVLDDEMTEAFAAIPAENRALVTNHHVFGYLAERFAFTVVGAAVPGGTTLASPSAADLEELATAIETTGVPTIFADSSQPDRLMQVLASEVGIDVDVVSLFTESLTEPDGGAPTYLDMMRANTRLIADGLTP
ncbi:zinc ABC transporter substrate-binding protein AztC [Microbacterium sediminis]|uniref:ABC transporter substrate-binding protein n=1 Tax=Microbacterium sediminis TaxID=904291 RepID=A0A1B9NCT0_9MICO|nr:zinc ABC transporter substrate-binding protein AztC [Microbacterium sediminis]OCG74407.1 ABC transporter substrate-binding protein [Microbacterium sediminis]QBR73777.1 zinc ABC transporter substrate-binding protein [Microbacterium sediminis]